MKNNKLNKGFTLLLSVLVTSIILSVGMGIFSIMTKELKLSGIGRESQIAFYAADAGVECFFFWEIKQSAFEPDGSANTISCAGNSIGLTDTDASGNSFYNFTLPFGISGNPCVKVEVSKDYSVTNKIITTVKSRGYNTACNSTSPFKVERAIQLVSTKQGGGGIYAPPNAPTNIVVNSNSFNKVNLSWNNSLGADSYTVYRSDDNNNFTVVVSGITGQNYTDGGLNKNTIYYYYVTAVGLYGESDPSGTVNAKTNDAVAVTFTYNGSSQTWPVPSGVTEILVSAYGASGGAAGGGGGKGGYASAIFDVNPSDTLYINVGGVGSALPGCSGGKATGGFNGGGDSGSTMGCPGTGGGGASDVRKGTNSLNNRIIVAGGGGGGGGGSTGKGGDGCTSGCDGGNGKVVGNGGGFGGSGGNSNISGGVGGTGVENGGNGIIGSGGKGGDGTWSPGMGSGGGGGGGYFGGGGGGSGNETAIGANDGGGGGGGSSYTSGLYPKYQNGVNFGNGQVIIEY